MTDAEIQAELLEAARAVHPSFRQRGAQEFQQEFEHRLLVALHNITDSAWNGLSTAAQQWYNTKVARLNRQGVPGVKKKRFHRATSELNPACSR